MQILNKTKKYANGTVLVTDFNKLNPDIFKPLYDFDKKQLKEQSILCTPNGKLYINRKWQGADTVAEMFELLIRENKANLLQFQQVYQEKFPNIKTFDDWKTMQGTDSDKMLAFAMLSVPVELKRREITLQYNGKISLFHG